MSLVIYNTVTRSKEELKPLESNKITIYACGPTVYNYIHIGNLRTFLVEDVFVKYLEYLGYNVYYIMNLTDVDDKTIKGSYQAKTSLNEFTNQYIDAFFKDITMLKFRKANAYPRATEYIQDMIDLIQSLLDKGFAYKVEDGSVYYAINKFDDYGKLSHLNQDDLKQGASERVKDDEYVKEYASDFVLWKSYKEEDHSVFWDSPFGKGRPGWHIECSAMSHAYLGDSFDIHFGGIDNMFPHHENEIAQSKAGYGGHFSRYFLHVAHLKMDKKKMSKSLGNTYMLNDLIEQGLDPKLIRYILISSHYRQELFFSDKLVSQSQKSLNKIWMLLQKIDHDIKNLNEEVKESTIDINAFLNQQLASFKEALNYDFNTPAALGVVFATSKYINKNYPMLSIEDKKATIQFFTNIDKIFDFLLPSFDNIIEDSLTEEETSLLEARAEAKANKDFAKADFLRDELQKKGLQVLDTNKGQIWERIISN